MTTNAKTTEKSIVVELVFDTETAKRVAWSKWKSTIINPFEIEVCNTSYGFEKRDNLYLVSIDEQGEPVWCTYKGYKHYHGPNDHMGKHMLAMATIGGQTHLNAPPFSPQSTPSGESITDTEMMSKKIKTDGGLPAELDFDPQYDCPELGGLPYWPCVRPRDRDLPKWQVERKSHSN